MPTDCSDGHLKRVWLWRAFWLPSTPPQPLTGWWAVCSRCGLSHEYDAGNVTRKWHLFRNYKSRGEKTFIGACWSTVRRFVPERFRVPFERNFLFGFDGS